MRMWPLHLRAPFLLLILLQLSGSLLAGRLSNADTTGEDVGDDVGEDVGDGVGENVANGAREDLRYWYETNGFDFNGGSVDILSPNSPSWISPGSITAAHILDEESHDGAEVPDPATAPAPTSDVTLAPRYRVEECTKLLHGTYLNCSSRNLQDIPMTHFPESVEVFDLSHNKLTALSENAFSHYTQLKKLFLSGNFIEAIDPLAFSGLSNLEVLDLYANKLALNSSTLQHVFPDEVFAPLTKLKKLRINRNNPHPEIKSLSYPGRALSRLSSLEELHMDGLAHKAFPSGFANMTRLWKLSLSGYSDGHCSLYGLDNDTFRYLSQMKQLNISSCSLQGHEIEAGAFLPLNQLELLDISHNQDINVQFFDRVFYGLHRTKTLTTLKMRFVVNLYTLGICLSSQYIKYFPPSVKYLDASENNFECIDRNVIDIIKPSMRELDISRNNFKFGMYLLDLPKMTKLVSFVINNYLQQANRLPRVYPYNPHTPPLETGNCSLYEENTAELYQDKFILRLPPNMQSAQILYARLSYVVSALHVDSNNSLQNLDLKGNYIPSLNGPILGLDKLKRLQMTSNDISYISDHFFESLSFLLTLNLSSNRLGDFFGRHHRTKVFRPLSQLRKLDLSFNLIQHFGQGLFKGLNQLKLLRLSHNPLIFFRSDISHMHQLQRLLFDDTRLAYLPRKTRDDIDLRLANYSHFFVDMESCPIFCGCENMAFLKWMAESNAFEFKSHLYKCFYPDTTSQLIYDGYKETLTNLERQCTPHGILLLLVGTVTGFAVLVILLSLGYRHRWKLRYFYYAAYLNLRPDPDASANNSFEFDAFICYAEEDRAFVMDLLNLELEARDIHVFIHDRDFTAGEFIGSNIVRAVRTCRRTVVVLTRALVESTWCAYEIQMANMEASHRGSPVLIFLLVDELSDSAMGVELLYNVRNNTYIPFPPDSRATEGTLRLLWDKLASDIRAR